MGSLPEIGENARALAVRVEDTIGRLPAVLKSQGEFESVGENLRELKSLANTVEAERQEWVVKPTRELKERWERCYGEPTRRIEAGITAVKLLMIGYQKEQEAIRQAEEARLRRIEEAKAAKERARLEEQARVEREKADKLRREAEAKAEAERARLQAEADKLKAKRDAESRAKRAELEAQAKAVEADTTKADAMAAKSAGHERQAEVTTAVDVRVESKVAPVAGVRLQVVWKFRVVDFKLLPDDFKVVNGVLLGGVARSEKEKAVVPGVEFYAESVMAARGA